MAIISITFIIISTVVLTLNTLPYFSQRGNSEEAHEKDYPPFALLEAIYMSWFTFEYLVRIFISYLTENRTDLKPHNSLIDTFYLALNQWIRGS